MTAEYTSSPDLRRLYSTAGWGGIAAFVAWMAQPIVVGLLAATEGDMAQTFDTISSRPYLASLELLIFIGIGVGILFLVTAVGRIVRARSAAPSTAARVGHVFGLAAGVSWIFAAGNSFAPYTSVGSGIPDTAPDPALQSALYQLNAVIFTGFGIAYAIGMAGWLITLATAGRRAGVVGWPTAILAVACSVASASVLVVPFSPPWGIIGGLAFCLVGGIVFLVKSRRVGT
ncbi:hypothetical protein BH10ACT7_BH10ACT7_01300 [soil metagenome]